MRNAFILGLVLFFCSYSVTSAQEYNEEKDSSGFFFGIHFGAFIPNNNSAELYTGTPAITPLGIVNILNRPQNRPIFDDYFVYPYEIAEFTTDPTYNTGTEIGLQLGWQFNRNTALFLDLNSYRLKFEQFFVMAIDNPNNQQLGPTFENIPIIGEENRFYMNLGVQLSLYNEECSNLYVSLFGNISDVELRRNYIVINNRDYEITHPNPDNPNQRLGGTALGGGSGLGFKFGLSEHILADLYYNIYYASSNFNDDFKDHAVQHSIGLRLLWN